MTETFLGFRKEMVDKLIYANYRKEGHFLQKFISRFVEEQVPVRLKSESVSLEFLEKYCKKNAYHLLSDATLEHTGKKQDDLIFTFELLKAARREAEKK